MKYHSTRGGGARLTAAEAIVRGLAPDGGLFVPDRIPKIDPAFIESLRPLSYIDRAEKVLSPWLTDFSRDELKSLLIAAYEGAFDDPAMAPVTRVSEGLYALELWHGPTLAFKDMALQLMPHLMTASRKKVGETRDVLILVATSGDTGKAALEGFQDVPGTGIAVFYPEGGVSQAQRLQMVTQAGENTHVIAVRGNFDDAQTGVKRIFSDRAFAEKLDAKNIVLSSANSINLGRLLPQIAYYFSAYADLRNQGALAEGGQLDVCVPTGNFGNILAAEYARRMGLPIRRLVCASNSNNVLADFIGTGVYDANRAFHLTSSPSMDILISSNLERMLHLLLGGDSEQLSGLMDGLKKDGKYVLPGAAHEQLSAAMSGGWADEGAVKAQIRETFERDGYLLDPHTAVAVRVLEDYRVGCEEKLPALVVSTASPYKFGRAVLEAVGGDAEGDDFACCAALAALAGQKVPRAIADLPGKAVRHRAVCEVSEMEGALVREMGL